MGKRFRWPWNREPSQLVQLWLQRPPHARTETDIPAFHDWLHVHRPDLLPAARYECPYALLTAALQAYITEPAAKVGPLPVAVLIDACS